MDDVIAARILTRCFGRYDRQPVEHALSFCLRCRIMKSCVQKSWGWKEKRSKRDPALWRGEVLANGRRGWRPKKPASA